MTVFRLDVSRDTGKATLWVKNQATPCGFAPVISWPNISEARDFAMALLELCRCGENSNGGYAS